MSSVIYIPANDALVLTALLKKLAELGLDEGWAGDTLILPVNSANERVAQQVVSYAKTTYSEDGSVIRDGGSYMLSASMAAEYYASVLLALVKSPVDK